MGYHLKPKVQQSSKDCKQGRKGLSALPSLILVKVAGGLELLPGLSRQRLDPTRTGCYCTLKLSQLNRQVCEQREEARTPGEKSRWRAAGRKAPVEIANHHEAMQDLKSILGCCDFSPYSAANSRHSMQCLYSFWNSSENQPHRNA